MEALVMLFIGASMAGPCTPTFGADTRFPSLLLFGDSNDPMFCFMLGELEISNITACGLAVVALVFLGSFVVALQTGTFNQTSAGDDPHRSKFLLIGSFTR